MVNRTFRATMRSRIRRRALRNWPELATLFLITVIGFTLANSFFVASSSVLGGLERFAEENNQQAGHFQLAQAGDEYERGEVSPGVEAVLSTDVSGPSDSTVRIFPPRESIDLHTVTNGQDLGSEAEVLIDEQFADAHELVLGDEVTLGDHSFDVVGFATAPDYVMTKTNELVLQPNADQFGIAFVTGSSFDERFSENANLEFSFDERTDLHTVIDRYDPALIRDSANNSRIQQVIGDSAAPRDLAVVIFVIFVAILVALVSVYHFGVRKREQADIATLQRLGLAGKLHRHYRVETIATLVSAWALSTVLTAVVTAPIMSINGRLYNYPPITVDLSVLIAVSLATLLVVLTVDGLCYRMVHRDPKSTKTRKSPRTPRLSMNRLRFVPDFGFRLRIVKALRKPREPLSLVALILIVSLFVNFSVLLKVSVDDYVEMLDTDTTYEYMYMLPDPSIQERLERGEDESARITTLYDERNVAQMVFSVPSDSRFFGDIDKPAATTAFIEKYQIDVGEEVTLTDINEDTEYRITVDRTVDNATSALIYVPDNYRIQADGTEAPSVPVLFTESEHPQLHETAPSVSRENVVSSGESIVEIIAIQVFLLISLSMALLAIMLFSIYRFTYGTQGDFIRVMRMNGYSAGTLNRAIFGFTIPTIILIAGISSFAASGIVRIFFDRIMSTFVTFVPTSTPYTPFVFTFSIILTLFTALLLMSRIRLNRS